MQEDLIQAALQFCDQHRIAKAVFIVPFEVTVSQVDVLRSAPCFSACILRNPDPAITMDSHYSWLGCYAAEGDEWQMPGNSGHYFYLGSAITLTPKMLGQLRKAKARFVTCVERSGFFIKIPLWRFRFWRLGERLVLELSNQRPDSGLHRAVNMARGLPGARQIWHLFFRRESRGMPIVKGGQPEGSQANLDLAFFKSLLALSVSESSRTPYMPVAGRIVLINSGLAAGGAERQILNTLKGLKERGFNDLIMLGEYLHRVPGLDFYLPQVSAAGIRAEPVCRRLSTDTQGFPPLYERLVPVLAELPSNMAEEILNLAEEFKALRPEVVHGWQDSTSIKVGIAALIVGVPRIVLASRNVTPVNFAYYQPYMRSAYQALAEQDEIRLINNSEAGAQDYCDWLGIGRERYKVVRNGVDFSGLKPISRDASRSYRLALGIPDAAPVVGSIFRFWSEKRPMLWLEACAKIASILPHVHFLLIGEGPMRSEMEAFIKRAGLSHCIHLPGARTEIATPLSEMDVFMLTSQFEGTPNVLLEAQWFGIAAVTTEAGGSREAIDEGVTGWCVAEPSSALLAKRVVNVLGDSGFMDSVRMTGPAFVARRFGMERMIDETLGLYGLVEHESESPHLEPFDKQAALT